MEIKVIQMISKREIYLFDGNDCDIAMAVNCGGVVKERIII